MCSCQEHGDSSTLLFDKMMCCCRDGDAFNMKCWFYKKNSLLFRLTALCSKKHQRVTNKTTEVITINFIKSMLFLLLMSRRNVYENSTYQAEKASQTIQNEIITLLQHFGAAIAFLIIVLFEPP